MAGPALASGCRGEPSCSAWSESLSRPGKASRPAFRGDWGRLMLRERTASRSEVMRAIVLEDSLCCRQSEPPCVDTS